MPPRSFSTTVIRHQDLLVLGFEFRAVEFEPPSGSQPGEIRGGPGAYLIVHFPPQHIAEQAFFQATDTLTQPDLPGNEAPLQPGAVGSRLAGGSRLVFTIPAAESIPYTLQGMLDALRRLPQSVTRVSSYEPPVPGCLPINPLQGLLRLPPPRVTPPGSTHTSLEVPFRLMLSPDGFARWSHASLPVELNGRTELWHTRLGSRRRNGDPRIRAIWSPDFQNTLQEHFVTGGTVTDADPFRTSLDARDRNELVHLTSNFHIGGFRPSWVDTDRLMLSTLGAWLRVQGDWDPPMFGGGSLTVEKWRHDAVMARDQYVRVVYAGYLFPFGHRASLVKVTERKFFWEANRQTPGFVAYLFQRMFIIVRERQRSYTHRAMPFRQVTIHTDVTPNLADPAGSQVGSHGQSAFWPRVSTAGGIVDFPFHLSAIDWSGQRSEFTSPLLFLDRNVDAVASNRAQVLAHYAGLQISNARRRRPFAGQPIAFAPPQKPRDTTLDAAAVSFGAEDRPSETPHFRPVMSRGEVAIPAVQQLAGSPASSNIEWEPTYLAASGTAIGNASQIFARVQGTTPLSFGTTEKTGGLVAPDIGISGLSRATGPVGGPVDQMVAGEFNPLDVFGDVKLLGGITLGQIIKDMTFSYVANTLGRVPGLTTVRDGDVIRTTYEWTVSYAEMVTNHGLFNPRPGSTFSLRAVVEKRLDTSTEPIFTATGELTDFSVMLLPAAELVEIDFESVTFKAVPDSKVDVSVQLRGVEFRGFLAFVNELRSFLPLDGFSDPPQLDIVTAPHPGLNLGFTLGLPTIGIGIMTMQNVSLSAGFFLPFGDAPLNFHFAFCQRQQPFILTVSLFGGGGFFSMDVGVHSVVMIEAALEFGASVAINLGVASGGVTVMAGIYFQKAGAEFSLTGYFRAAGSLSVLGIITVSLEFYLGLSYASKGISPHGGALWGQAKLTVKIEILFFSASVSVSMERAFAGSDPTFRQLVSPNAWAEYCDAFAAYA